MRRFLILFVAGLMASLLVLAMTGSAHATPYPGPDDFGYTGSQIAENLRTISGPEIVEGDDTVEGPFPIGFPFDFYGTDYRQVWVSSNGFLSFGSVGNGCCDGQPFPQAADGMSKMVAGFWTDLCPGCGGTVSYETTGTAPNREFVVDYDMSFYCCGGPTVVNFQIILHENSDIELQYGQMDEVGYTASAGIEDETETMGLQVVLGADAASSLEHRGFLISTALPAPPQPPPFIPIPYYDLAVSKVGSGSVSGDPHLRIDCGSNCFSHLAQWTYGTLVATPDEGWEFGGWSGPCLDHDEDASNECTVNIAGNQSITATFTESEPPPPATQCADGIDNDGDGLIDFPQDPGCTDLSDDDESEPAPSVTEHPRTIAVEVGQSLDGRKRAEEHDGDHQDRELAHVSRLDTQQGSNERLS